MLVTALSINVPRIRISRLPDGALLKVHVGTGAYTDCYAVDFDHPVSHQQFVVAFYTTWLFKLERWILSWAVKRPSTDRQAQELARGNREQFAAWSVEARARDQLLLRDLHGHTRSWLMTTVGDDAVQGTRLYFGSAVVARVDPVTGETSSPGLIFRALLGFHQVYSILLLRAACSKLARQQASA